MTTAKFQSIDSHSRSKYLKGDLTRPSGRETLVHSEKKSISIIMKTFANFECQKSQNFTKIGPKYKISYWFINLRRLQICWQLLPMLGNFVYSINFVNFVYFSFWNELFLLNLVKLKVFKYFDQSQHLWPIKNTL